MNGTIKCPICGEPYTWYSHTVADQTACPGCVAKAQGHYTTHTSTNYAMSLPKSMEWEPINDPDCADGWVGILGASDFGWDYYYGRGPAGSLYLEIVEQSDGVGFEGMVDPDQAFSIKVKDRLHAERIIRAIES